MNYSKPSPSSFWFKVELLSGFLLMLTTTYSSVGMMLLTNYVLSEWICLTNQNQPALLLRPRHVLAYG